MLRENGEIAVSMVLYIHGVFLPKKHISIDSFIIAATICLNAEILITLATLGQHCPILMYIIKNN